NIEAEFQQFAMNMRSAPGVVLGDHLEDQIPHLFTNPLSSQSIAMSGQPTPVQTKSGSMPARHRFGGDIHQSLFPFGPQPFGNHPEQPIKATKSWLRLASLKSQQLLAKGKVLQ